MDQIQGRPPRWVGAGAPALLGELGWFSLEQQWFEGDLRAAPCEEVFKELELGMSLWWRARG